MGSYQICAILQEKATIDNRSSQKVFIKGVSPAACSDILWGFAAA